MTTSDDVLRQQLGQALHESFWGFSQGYRKLLTDNALPAIWPLIEAWGDARVAAARAETAEQIAQEIENKQDYLCHITQHGSPSEAAYVDCAKIARSVPGTTEGGNE